jgi:hypothetical protein
MQLKRQLFWDINYDTIHWDEKYRFVIVRVFERGDIDVREALLETKYISQHRLYLAAAVIDEPIEKFRCYIPKQSTPTLFPY